MQRIQHGRRRKLPQGARYVGRPSRWGNPFMVKIHGRQAALELFRDKVSKMSPGARSAWLYPLRDASALACWCKPGEACHADILIEFLGEEQ